MPRCASAWRTAGAGSTTLPAASLYATTTCQPRLIEVHIFNTTATGLAVALKRLSTTGTQGSTVTGTYEDDDSHTVLATPKDTHTVAPTLAGTLRQATLGAAVGAGLIWTFGGVGLIIENATTNGIGIIPATGTGQILDVAFVWDE
jgi:hypothetical protein